MANSKRCVLITGCSEGSAGHALAREFVSRGFRVYATARSASKMASLRAEGIDTLELDITSDDSIQACLKQVDRLDILVNNAGASLTMPVVDLPIREAKELFDLNVWGHLAVIQAFMPLLLKAPKAMIVNHTSVGADMVIPYQAAYNASKACLARFTETLRLELRAFDIAVVELKSGGIKTNIVNNVAAKKPTLPENSIYAPAKETVEGSLRQEWFHDIGITAEQWAREVVKELTKKNPPRTIWKGESAFSAWLATFLPVGSFDGMISRMTRLDKAEQIIRGQRTQ